MQAEKGAMVCFNVGIFMWGHGYQRSDDSVLWCIYSLGRGTIKPSVVNSFN